MGRLVINATHGKEDAERATLAFIVGATAVGADQECTIILTVEGVWLVDREAGVRLSPDRNIGV